MKTAHEFARDVLGELEKVDAADFAGRVEQLKRNYERIVAAVEADRIEQSERARQLLSYLLDQACCAAGCVDDETAADARAFLAAPPTPVATPGTEP